MNGWETFWYWVIWSALGTYFGLGIFISVGGFFDVKKMFRRLDAAHHERVSADTSSEPRP